MERNKNKIMEKNINNEINETYCSFEVHDTI